MAICTYVAVLAQNIFSNPFTRLDFHSALNFANDSMHTCLCLQFDPQQIATATVYLSCQFANVRPVNRDWLDALDQPDVETLVSIALQIIEVITDRKGVDEPTFALLRRDLEALKNAKKPAAEVAAAAPEAKRQRTE